MTSTTSRTTARRRTSGTLATVAAGALAAALLGAPTSYAGGPTPPTTSPAASASAASAPDVSAARGKASARKPRVRIGQLITRSPSTRYRFTGKKGQRVILMPDGWPNETHGCVGNASLSRGERMLKVGSIGDWRLPRSGTYRLRIGPSCVSRLSLRLRRHEQVPRGVDGDLPTRFTRTLMRSALVRLPDGQPVVLETVNGGRVSVAGAKPDGSPFMGCSVHVLTAGVRSKCAAGEEVARRVIVSAPEPSSVRLADVVTAQVDGAPVTVPDPATTLVQVEVPGPTALRVDGPAVPHAGAAARPWASLTSLSGDGDGWDVTGYHVENADGTRLPSGWRITRGGTYVFQLNRHLVGDGPQTLAVRTSPNPPPGVTIWQEARG